MRTKSGSSATQSSALTHSGQPVPWRSRAPQQALDHRSFQARHHLAHEERVVRHAEFRADPLRPAGPLALASTQQALDFVAHGALQAFAGTIAGQVEAQAGLFLALQGAASGQRQFGKVVAHDRCSLSRRQAISDYCTFIQ
ncbi:hypothetical protein K652_16937 [Pseudomonas aeruginosa VRFPA02]|nr:hypothetical protein K652_16937 [Pseudomonas aeruginosa VRFPA02]